MPPSPRLLLSAAGLAAFVATWPAAARPSGDPEAESAWFTSSIFAAGPANPQHESAATPDGTGATPDSSDPGAPPPANRSRWGPPGEPIQFTLQGGGGYQFRTDLDEGGDFSIARAVITPQLAFRLNEQLSLSVRFTYAYDGYDFSGSGFGALDPWSDVHALSLGGGVRWALDDEWTIVGGASLRVAGESGADFGDAIFGGGFAGFTYNFGDKLTIGPGVIALTQIEDDVLVFPILLINWKITDDLTFRTGGGFGATLGPGVELAWKFSDEWEVGLGGRFERLRFRLDDSGPAPDGVGEDESLGIALAVRYEPSQKLAFEFVTAFIVDGNLRLEDDGGNKITDSDYDATVLIGLTARFRF